jgi:glycosyltransferase involved in cell wall biosynthesis
MNLTIIVPTYNAESFIQTTIDKLLLNFEGSEIIIINDGSQDETSEKIKKYQDRIKIVEHSINQGKGKALRSGFQVSTKDIIIFTDADLPYGIDNIRRIYNSLINNNCDVAVGYRQNFKENI